MWRQPVRCILGPAMGPATPGEMRKQPNIARRPRVQWSSVSSGLPSNDQFQSILISVWANSTSHYTTNEWYTELKNLPTLKRKVSWLHSACRSSCSLREQRSIFNLLYLPKTTWSVQWSTCQCSEDLILSVWDPDVRPLAYGDKKILPWKKITVLSLQHCQW